MSERASLTQNTKLGAALWIGDRLVARIAGTVENSRITPDDPVPQWRKDAITFVDAVNVAHKRSAGAAPLDVDALAAALRAEGFVRGVASRYGTFNDPYWEQSAEAIIARLTEGPAR